MSAYIAIYLPDATYDEREIVIARDGYWSGRLSELWDRLMSTREPGDPMLQGWYSDSESALCLRRTIQSRLCKCCGLDLGFLNSAPNGDNDTPKGQGQ